MEDTHTKEYTMSFSSFEKDKMIFENWRRYTASPKVIELSLLQESRNFGRMLTEQELLRESDSDPEALSIEDIEALTPEEIQAAYDQMLAGEAEEVVKQRIEQYDEYENLRNEKKAEIEDLPSGPIIALKHFAQKALGALFGNKVETERDIKNAELEKITQDIRNIFTTALNPLQREMFRAIQIWTGQQWDTIRDADNEELRGLFVNSKFKRAFEFLNDGLEDVFVASRDTFRKAKLLLMKMTQIEFEKPKYVHRGLSITRTKGEKGFPGLDEYVVGSELNFERLASFSISERAARDFAETNRAKDEYSVILHIGELKKGLDVDKFSQYEKTEKEIIVSGRFKIAHLGLSPNSYSASMQPDYVGAKTFDELEAYVQEKGHSYTPQGIRNPEKRKKKQRIIKELDPDRVMIHVYLEHVD